MSDEKELDGFSFPTPIDETWYVRPEKARTRTSAGGIVVRREGDRILVALTREGDMAHYLLPKGGVEKGESLLEAARREIQEEAGISDLTLRGELGARERLDFIKRRWITTYYYLFSTAQIETHPTDASRDYNAGWFDLNALPLMLWPEQRELIEKSRDKIIAALG